MAQLGVGVKRWGSGLGGIVGKVRARDDIARVESPDALEALVVVKIEGRHNVDPMRESHSGDPGIVGPLSANTVGRTNEPCPYLVGILILKDQTNPRPESVHQIQGTCGLESKPVERGGSGRDDPVFSEYLGRDAERRLPLSQDPQSVTSREAEF